MANARLDADEDGYFAPGACRGCGKEGWDVAGSCARCGKHCCDFCAHIGPGPYDLTCTGCKDEQVVDSEYDSSEDDWGWLGLDC